MAIQKIDRYEIKAELARGGMGTVYHAYDPHFSRDVALKVLPRQFVDHPTLRARFEREAQIIASLEHPAIVPVYDFGDQDEQLYLVMRFMPGGSLADRLNHVQLTLAEASQMLAHLAPALDEAHAKGIIHRDLKPDNILFDQNDNPYVTDFGIAKLSESTSHLTGTAIIGTPAYMSPEQVHGDKVIDGRSDIYALGIILFEMLTGQKPYQADTPTKLMMKHVLDPVPNVLAVKPDLPPDCRTVIDKAIAKKPDARYQSAAALVSALQNVLAASQPSPTLQLRSKRKKGPNWPSILGVLFALLLLVIGAFLWTRYNQAQEAQVAAIAQTQSAMADADNTTQDTDTPVEEGSGTQDSNESATENSGSTTTTSTLPPAPTSIQTGSTQDAASTPTLPPTSTPLATFTLAPGETPVTETPSPTTETTPGSPSPTSTPTENNQATATVEPTATFAVQPTSTAIQINDSTNSSSTTNSPPSNTPVPVASPTEPQFNTSASAPSVTQAPPTQAQPTPTQAQAQPTPTQAQAQPTPTQAQAQPTQAQPTPTQAQAQPTQAPPTPVPPTPVPPTPVPPTPVPPTPVPPTPVPPTPVPPTPVPPTPVPPTPVPPTPVPPTPVPPTPVPPTQPPATRNVGISLLSPAQNETIKSNEVQFRVQVNGFQNGDRLQLRAGIDQNNLFNEGVSFSFDGSAHVANMNYQPGGFGFGQTYLWQVVVFGPDGTQVGSSGISQFRWEQPGGGGGSGGSGPALP